jgi:hypothetical protein
MGRRTIRLLAQNYAEDWPEVEAILSAHRARLKIMEVPVQMSERSAGRSSISTLRSVVYMVKVPLAILMNLIRSQHIDG